MKIIDKDHFKEGGVINRLQAILPVSDTPLPYGKPLPPGQYKIKFPAPNREGRIDTFEEPLRRVLKKANKQIKQTRARLLDDKAYGLVFLALNMDTLIDLEVVCELIEQLLIAEFSGISGLIVGSPALAFQGDEGCCICKLPCYSLI